jgi:exosome complex component RRP46
MRPNVGLPGIREKSMEYHIKDILDGVLLTNLNPRTSINLTIQEIQNNGSVS